MDSATPRSVQATRRSARPNRFGYSECFRPESLSALSGIIFSQVSTKAAFAGASWAQQYAISTVAGGFPFVAGGGVHVTGMPRVIFMWLIPRKLSAIRIKS